jgi:tetratricopeptide (TPR) repeat protein
VLLQGRGDEGRALLTTAVTQLQAVGKDEQSNLSTARIWLGRVLLDQGRLDDAEAQLAAAADYLRRFREGHPSRAEADCELARLFAARGRNAEALALAESCVPHLKNAGQMDPARKRDAERLLAKLRTNQQ